VDRRDAHRRAELDDPGRAARPGALVEEAAVLRRHVQVVVGVAAVEAAQVAALFGDMVGDGGRDQLPGLLGVGELRHQGPVGLLRVGEQLRQGPRDAAGAQ